MSIFWTVKGNNGTREFSLKRLGFVIALLHAIVAPNALLIWLQDAAWFEKLVSQYFSYYMVVTPLLLSAYMGKNFLEQKFAKQE